jgi:ATP-binding cassette subfamily F protein 3
MIKVENLSYSFPQKDLYKKISFTLEAGNHCAFIGTSGNGKSTLIDILMDPERFHYDGTLEIDPHCHIGYISQFPQLDKPEETTVIDYIGEDYFRLQKEIEDVCKAMETSTNIEKLLETYQEALDAFNAIDGDNFESNVNKKLNLAGLLGHKDLAISKLSGGEFKLIQVIKEMLHNPELVIMDEPDVFLDFENINALKDLINSHKGMLLVITHNRYLLNHCFNKIIHLENMELQEFDGRYMDYNFTLLQKKIELQELSTADDDEIERNQVIIDRLRLIATENRDAGRGRALKARVKIQERLMARRIKAPFVDIKQPRISLTTKNPIEECVGIEVKDYKLAFNEVLLEDVNFEIKSNEKVALIGNNGTGKTTLLRQIAQNDHPSIKIHEDVEITYLSQSQGEVLDESNTILQEFFDIGFKTTGEIKSYLRKYEVDTDHLKRKINTLSGGEKNVLQIAKISASKANMLLLDEPTSHLDTYAQIALENAIADYTGGILMVSHDYYTIANSMDYVLLIEDKTIRKMSMRKFRKMIYKNHFNKDYLQIEQQKKETETKIALALKGQDYELAKDLSVDLEAFIKQL